MNKPARDWTEDDVLSLPLEDDTLERKGSRLLDLTLSDVDENKVVNELAKQLSAFVNTGGGRILYGVTDAGQVDNGGVSQVIKGACLLVEGGVATVGQQDYPSIVKSRPAPGGGVYWEWVHPIYPEMETNFSLSCHLHLEKRLSGAGSTGTLYHKGTDNRLDDVTLHCRIFADSAPPNGGSVQLGGPTLIQKIQSDMAVSGRP